MTTAEANTPRPTKATTTMNMSYCRYRNTVHDLIDCKEDLEERINGNAQDQLSKDELEAAIRLILNAQDLIGAIREAIDIYGEEDLTKAQITEAWAKIEKDATRYREAE